MTDHRALAEELREYTAMKYAGDCKCGKCQLVPRALVERIYHTLNSTRGEPQEVQEALDKIAKFATSAEMEASVAADCSRSEFAASWHSTAELADFRGGYDECIQIARSSQVSRPQSGSGQ
jgi:hypothetical protein